MNTTPTFTEEERMALLEDAAERWSEALFRFAALRCASRSDAEDVVQEAFLRFATATTPVLCSLAVPMYHYPLVSDPRKRPPRSCFS